ncbi:FAD-dependent oxidoreductase [Hoeflea sp.]|uniref:FAD-dependent oxidoreductase n=1 Tax=Hoeflea sp. TaxID=1940281 RepID=UPI003B022D63
MSVAVLGGGLQGCCLAMALADRGVDVVLIDRNDRLMTQAAVANEGKIHLGYMYAADLSLRTARKMMEGALSFAPFFSRYLGTPRETLPTSNPAVYLAHRDSQRDVDEIAAYLKSVHQIINDQPASVRDGYFGRDLLSPPERWTQAALEREFDPELVMGAFSSPEVAIDPVALTGMIRERIAQTPNIDIWLNTEVLCVDGEAPLVVVTARDGQTSRTSFDHVANALWDGRLSIDERRGLRPQRPWIYRLKYGVAFRPAQETPVHRAITVISGPFGEVVPYADGTIYLTWYPACVRALDQGLVPPDWPMYPDEPVRSEILQGTFDGLAELMPELARCDLSKSTNIAVRGGKIVAWGNSDIYDPDSELHQRFEIGVSSVGHYHTVDPGKLTLAPLFATECADRIAPDPALVGTQGGLNVVTG